MNSYTYPSPALTPIISQLIFPSILLSASPATPLCNSEGDLRQRGILFMSSEFFLSVLLTGFMPALC